MKSELQFPVNSGNVPPPSQSSNLLSHQLNLIQNITGFRKKSKETSVDTSKLKLERILGLTCTSNNTLAIANDLIAYAAGAVVVIYNYKRNKQVGFLYSPSITPSESTEIPLITPLNNTELPLNQNTNTDDKKPTQASTRAKPISCLTFSPDGNYLAAGEMGHQPRIFIWDIKEKKLIKEIKCHKFGILALSFSPNMRYLVSVGFQHDGYLYVWDWRKGTQLAGNKVTSKVNAISFSKDASYFVTAGLRHVKFWYLNSRMPKKGNIRETQVLDGRSGILGVLRDANFVDVACHGGYTYFITDTGILCIFKEGRVIDKWVDLQVKNAYSIAVSSNYVICTCSEGVIRLFEPVTLKYAGILPKPHPLGVDISLVTSPDMIKSQDMAYPDSVAMVYDQHRVITVYSDKSLYVWDIRDLNKIGKYRSFIFHSDCVWGAEPCPPIEREDHAIPLNSFATFSADGTIRIWNLDNPLHSTSTSTSPLSPNLMSPSSSTAVMAHRRNIYSRELVKMLYVDSEAAEFSKKRNDYESAPDFGIRALKMSGNGELMASGDRNGNLRVHDMNTWSLLTFQEAHDSEILSIDLTTPKDKDSPSLVATASRDRLLHVFDIKSNYQLVQSLDDHSSSITSVRFTKDSNRLISCGADKGIIFRQRNDKTFTTYHNYSGRNTVFDMSVDISDRYVATVTGERKLYVFNIESGKPSRICKPEMTEEVVSSGGSLMNIDMDPFSGTFAVTSGSDRCIRLFDLTNSVCIEKVCAHSELITSVKFIKTNVEPDGLRVLSTCSDGTVFVWKVNPDIVAKMCARAIDPKLKSPNNKRIRRVSAAIRPTASISQMIRERKTFSTMSTAEQKYDDLYKRKTNKSPEDVNRRLDRLYNGLPVHKTNQPPLVQYNKPNPLIRTNPVLRKAISRDAIIQPTRKSPTPKPQPQPQSRRSSQPIIQTKKQTTKSEEDSSSDNDADIETNIKSDEDEDDEDDEEEIIFTPEQDRLNKPFEILRPLQLDYIEEDEEEEVVSSDKIEEDESSSEDNLDDAIHRDIIALEPPRISTSISRNTIIKTNSQKRQSITARYLSSLNLSQLASPQSDNEQHTLPEPKNYLIDVAPAKKPTTTTITTTTTTNTIPKTELTIDTNVNTNEENIKLDNALSDLDGIHILLDSVLDIYKSTNKNKHSDKLKQMETKLMEMHQKINTIQPQDSTSIMLEKYSNLLLNLVEKKLNK